MPIFFSAFTGFASFFLFLGFGYFDPLHAIVTSILLLFFLIGVGVRRRVVTQARVFPVPTPPA